MWSLYLTEVFFLEGPLVITHEDLSYRISSNSLPSGHIGKEPIPPRHRRKRREDEPVTNSSQLQDTKDTVNAKGAQFDLEDSAFPPLPGE